MYTYIYILYMAARRLSKYKKSPNPKFLKNPQITKSELCNLYILQNNLCFFLLRNFPIFFQNVESILAFLVYLYNKSLF